MKALWLENQSLRFRECPVPVPGEGEALIRVRLAGICSTDLEMVRGYYPFTGIPGHEFAGEVVQVGGEAGQGWIGKRVVGEINVWCGECAACQRGDVTHCAERVVLGLRGHAGVFAQYLTLPLRNLHPIPDDVPDEAAVFAEPLAAALEIQEQVNIRPDSRVLVVGAGRLGQLAAQTLALTGCRLEVAARHPRQRELLAKRGIALVDEAGYPAGQADVVVEASGSQNGWNLARRAVRPRGLIVLKSTYAGEISINFSSVVVDEITLVGSRCGPFAPALRLMENKQVDPTGLIEAEYRLDEGVKAYEHAARKGVLKVLLRPE